MKKIVRGERRGQEGGEEEGKTREVTKERRGTRRERKSWVQEVRRGYNER